MQFPKVLTRALMIALAYEIVFKLAHVFSPALFEDPVVLAITRPLGVIVGAIMILFLVAFYQAERSNRGLALALQILIVVVILAFLLRLPVAQTWLGFQTGRLSSEIIGIVRSALFIMVLILYRRKIAGSHAALSYAVIALAGFFGVGVIVNLIALVAFASYLNSGAVIEPAPVITALLFLLFVLTRLAAIYFLYRYEKLELK